MKINLIVEVPEWTKFVTVSAQGIYCHDEEPDLIHAESEKMNQYFCMSRNKELVIDSPAIIWEHRAHEAYVDFMRTLEELDREVSE